MFSQLTTSQSKKKLLDYHTIVTKKRRLKEESQKRKPRKPSLELADSPPWYSDDKPRYHEDPVTAMAALNTRLGIERLV